jgi:hypothetical protein
MSEYKMLRWCLVVCSIRMDMPMMCGSLALYSYMRGAKPSRFARSGRTAKARVELKIPTTKQLTLCKYTYS